jgi:TPR repeat protein
MKSILVKVLIVMIVSICFCVATIMYWNARFDEGASALKVNEYGTVLERLEPLAALGDSRAQYIVGELYAFGLGVAKDDERAVMWFRKSALDHQSERERAAPAEYYVAQEYAGMGGGLVERNNDEAKKWLRRAAEGGHKPAAALLAKAYSEGLLGLSQDSNEAKVWLEKSKLD